MTGESNERSHCLYGSTFASYLCSYSSKEVTTYKKFHLDESHFQLRLAPRKIKSTLSSLIRYSD